MPSRCRLKTLPDLTGPNLSILFVGINPGLLSAHKGHYYSKKGNHFWPCLARSGLVPVHFGPENDTECLEHSVGLTDIVQRCTRAQTEITRDEFDEGAGRLREKLKRLNPMCVVFNGKQIYANFRAVRLKDVKCGVQDYQLEGCVSRFYVMTNSSALNAHFPTADSRMFYYEEIKSLVGKLKKSPYFQAVKEQENFPETKLAIDSFI